MADHASTDAGLESPRWSLPRGRVLQRALRHHPTAEYFTYVPTDAAEQPPVLVAVHGASHNADQYATLLAPFCAEHKVIFVIPRFSEQYRDFQRLGREGHGPRADKMLHQCISEVGTLTGADISEIFLFGYSAGAQFAHRYLMAYPHRVARAVVAAAGWYTFPDPTQRFPYGIRPVRALPGVTFNPEAFLKVPIEVFVGALDVGSSNLRKTERTNAQQGRTRVERARRWVEAMQEAAKSYGMIPATTYTEVPGVGHAFSEFCGDGNLIPRVFDSLIGDLRLDAVVPESKAS